MLANGKGTRLAGAWNEPSLNIPPKSKYTFLVEFLMESSAKPDHDIDSSPRGIRQDSDHRVNMGQHPFPLNTFHRATESFTIYAMSVTGE
jgi:hypothetical protein